MQNAHSAAEVPRRFVFRFLKSLDMCISSRVGGKAFLPIGNPTFILK